MQHTYWGEPFARAFMEHLDEHPALRIAHGLRRGWEEMPLEVHENDYFLGHPWRPSVVSYHYGSGLRFDRALAEEWSSGLSAGEGRTFEEICAYFREHNTKAEIDRRLRAEGITPKCGFDEVFWAGGWGGHALLDYDLLLREGVTGIQRRVDDALGEAQTDEESQWLEAVRISGSALVVMAERFAAAAERKAKETKDPRAHRRLVEAAAICRKVPRYPAETLREALQAFWLAFLFDGIDSPGRFDQYMYPYHRADLDSGRTTPDQAREMLEAMWVNFEKVRAWNLCIGGQTREGEDATNELTYLVLDMAEKYRFRAPNLTMRWHSGTPLKARRRALEVIATGIGMPALYNDEVVIPALVSIGIPEEDARGYAMNGCNQIDIQGKSHMGLEDGEMNLLKCLELALNNGRSRLTGRQIGPATGDPRLFQSFEELMRAFKEQVAYLTECLARQSNISQQVYAETAPDPWRSLLVADCIRKRRDFKNGGPVYNHGQILTQGIGNTADALAAIKEFVFERELYSMADVIAALDANWEGYEQMRYLLAGKARKYGNDDDCVDSLAKEAVEYFLRQLRRHRTFRGGIFTGGSSVFTRGPMFGRKVGATPDGRLSGTTLADSVGPVQGKDRCGPSAVLKSVTKLDLTLACSGYVLNLKFDRSMFRQDEVREKIRQLIETYFDLGGQQVQVNVTDADELRKAKENPDQYPNLVVRVGGFSEYFRNLSPELQGEIISRTAHTA